MKRTFLVVALILSIFMITGTAMAGSSSTATANSNVGLNNSNTDINVVAPQQGQYVEGPTFEADNRKYEDMPRGFPNGTEIVYPGIIPYYGPDTRPFNFTPMSVIVQGKNVWKRYECEPTLEDSEIEYRFRSFVPTEEGDNPLDSVDVMLGLPETKNTYRVLAHITLRADDTRTTSLELLAQACLLGMASGGRTIAIVAEGAERVATSSGWGIGIHSSGATVNDSNDVGTVTSGGTGYSSGKASLEGKPWIQVFVLTY